MKQMTSISFIVGAVMLLLGATMYVTGWHLSPYLYIVGATLIALAQFNTSLPKKTLVLKRLYRQQLFGALLLVLAGVFMVTTHGNEWIVCMSIGAILELYTAFRIPQEEEKTN